MVEVHFGYLAIMVAFSLILVVYFLVVFKSFVVDLGQLSFSYGNLFCTISFKFAYKVALLEMMGSM